MSDRQDIRHRLLEGMVDFHVHADPSLFSRYADDRTLAQEMSRAKMGGFVLKAHEGDSQARAWLLQKEFPNLLVRGGVVLNPPVGGLNPDAVETSLKLGGKVIWLPTMYSFGHHLSLGDKSGVMGLPRVPGAKLVPVLTPQGRPRSELMEIFDLIKQHQAVLETGHVSGVELFQTIKAAQEVGVERIVVTHVDYHVPNLSLSEQRDLGRRGVYLEKCYLTFFPGNGYGSPSFMAESIQEIGKERIVLGTDFGQLTKGSPVEGMKEFLALLLESGVSLADLTIMGNVNPRALLA